MAVKRMVYGCCIKVVVWQEFRWGFSGGSIDGNDFRPVVGEERRERELRKGKIRERMNEEKWRFSERNALSFPLSYESDQDTWPRSCLLIRWIWLIPYVYAYHILILTLNLNHLFRLLPLVLTSNVGGSICPDPLDQSNDVYLESTFWLFSNPYLNA